MTKVSGWDEIKQLAKEVREKLKEAGSQASAEIKEQWTKVEPHVAKIEEKAMAAGDKFEHAADQELTSAVDKVKEFREQLRTKAAAEKKS
jgi:hypothetical protein